jgi:hypothetical protein
LNAHTEFDPMLIASAPRSGSSMTAGIIAKTGVHCGWTKPGDEWNAKGYFEHVPIDTAQILYLRSCDHKHEGKRFQPLDLDEPYPDFRDFIQDCIKSEYPESNGWMFKSTKTAICRNIWVNHFPEAKWVICRRDRELILDSMMRAPFMDAYSERDEWDQMLNRYEYYFRDIIDRCTAFEFDVDAAVNGSVEEVRSLFSFLNISYSPARAHSFIDRSLIRARN